MDVYLSVSTVLLIVLGCLFIYSSGYVVNVGISTDSFFRQLIWIAISIAIAVAIFLFDLTFLEQFATIIYGIVLALLIVTLLFGREVNGARSWLGIGSIGFQISEFAKLALILFLAKQCNIHRNEIHQVGNFIRIFFLASAPTFLVLVQPDLGTAIIFPLITVVMLYFGGARIRHLSFVLTAFVASVGIIILYAWFSRTGDYVPSVFSVVLQIPYFLLVLGSAVIIMVSAYLGYYYARVGYFYWISYICGLIGAVLILVFGGLYIFREYQLSRLVVFLDPYQDPLGTGWHIIQSLTAIGSGGFLGQGYMQGLQSHLRFVPEQNTDFIFSILAEEFGFIGVVGLFVLYGILIFRVINVSAIISHKRFFSLVCIGVASMFAFHFSINIGVALGLLPIIGIPLFFLSYGGSSLLLGLSSIAVVLNCHTNRYKTY